MDPQRGGWYDVVERTLQAGEKIHRYAWHDRKAWWQQEQAILAYLILAGVHKNAGIRETRSRESQHSTTLGSSIRTVAASTSTCWPTAHLTCWAPSARRAATP